MDCFENREGISIYVDSRDIQQKCSGIQEMSESVKEDTILIMFLFMEVIMGITIR